MNTIDRSLAERLRAEAIASFPFPVSAEVGDIARFLDHVQMATCLKSLVVSRLSLIMTAWVLCRLTGGGLIRLARQADGYWVEPTEPVGPTAHPHPFHFVAKATVTPETAEYLRTVLNDVRRRYDSRFLQSRDTFNSALRRLAFVASFGDHTGGRALILGDDAMFGLTLGLAGAYEEIVVTDIDEALLALIRTICREMSIRHVQTLQYDVRHAPHARLLSCFDRFFASGWKDVDGLLLFVLRGIASLRDPKQGKAGYIVYGDHSVGDAAVWAKLRFQKTIVNLGCVIDAVAPCIQAEFPAEFEDLFADMILRNSGNPEPIAALLTDFKAFEKAETDVCWMLHPEFPNISLAPLNLAKIRPLDGFRPEMSRYLRLAELGARRDSLS